MHRVAGIGCVQASGSPESGPYCTGKLYGARYEKPTSELRLTIRKLLSSPMTAQCVTCRGPRDKKVRLNFLSSMPRENLQKLVEEGKNA